MAAKKTVRSRATKRVVKKTTRVTTKDEFSLAMLLGIFSLVSAMAGMVSFQMFMGLVAISLGLMSIWMAVRNHEFKFIFLGVAGTLISLIGLWDIAVVSEQAVNAIIFGY